MKQDMGDQYIDDDSSESGKRSVGVMSQVIPTSKNPLGKNPKAPRGLEMDPKTKALINNLIADSASNFE